MSKGIDELVRKCAKEQLTAYRVGGIAAIASGILLTILAALVEGKEGEGALRVGAGILGVFLVGAGVAYLKVMAARLADLVELLVARPSELRSPVIVVRRRGRIVISHAITVKDPRGRTHRMRVPSEGDARRLLANVPTT